MSVKGRHDLRNGQGATLVEFALTLSLLFTVLFGIMEFSRVLYAYHFISNAAREATRYASVRGSTYSSNSCSSPPPVEYNCEAATTDITAYVQSILAPTVYVIGTATASCAAPALSHLNVCVSYPGTAPTGATGACAGGESPGCLVKVEVLYDYALTLPYVSQNLSSISMTSTSETVIQQ